MKYAKLIATSLMLIIAPLAGHPYLIPVLALMLAIVLENDFSISSKIKMLVDGRNHKLVWYEVFLMKRYGADKAYIAITIENGNKTWYARVNNCSASGTTFDKLVEQLDRNLEIHERTKRTSTKIDVLV